MLIEQHLIGYRLYSSFTRSYSPLPRQQNENSWMRYARHRRDRWGLPRYDASAEAIYKRRDGNFASLLASYTAQLEYEGKTLFAIAVGTYTEGDDFWAGAVSEHSAFTIRTLGDYNAAWEHFFPEDDGYDYDLGSTHDMNYVVAPTSVIE
jgi:hypothetical protein